MSEAEDTASHADPLISRTLGGRYEISRLLARGQSSSVYLANHSLLGSPVAIKVLTKASPENIKRFQREAKILSALKHPNIVGISSFGNEDELLYLVMDLLAGDTLTELIDKQSLTVESAVQIALQLCSGLDYAHQQGVLHRDLNSANVMLVQNEEHLQVKILDFGLSKISIDDAIAAQDASTGSGRMAGTPAYMSPEQCRGESPSKSSDIYAFGCLFYQVLAGRVPFLGNTTLETMDMQINADVPPLTVTAANQLIPQALKKIVERSLKKDPSQRFASFAEIEQELRGISTSSLKFAAYAGKDAGTRAWLPALLVFMLLACGLATFLVFYHRKPVEEMNVGTSIIDSYEADWKGKIETKPWVNISKRVEVLDNQWRADESEALLKRWLAAPGNLERLSPDNCLALVQLCARISGHQADSTVACRIVVPYIPVLRKKLAAHKQLFFQVIRSLLDASVNPGASAAYREPSLELKALLRDFRSPYRESYVVLGLEKAARLMNCSAPEEACFLFSITKESIEQQFKSAIPISNDELIRYNMYFQSFENACLSELHKEEIALSALRFRMKLIERLKRGNIQKAESYYKQSLILAHLERIDEARASLSQADKFYGMSSQQGANNCRTALCKKALVLSLIGSRSDFDSALAEWKRTFPIAPGQPGIVIKQAVSDLDLCRTFYTRFQRFEEAAWCLELTNMIREQQNDRAGILASSINLVEYLERAEKYQRAEELFSSVKEQLISYERDTTSRAMVESKLATLALEEGDLKKAKRVLQDALAFCKRAMQEYKKNGEYGNLLAVCGRLALAEGRIKESSDFFGASAEVFSDPVGTRLNRAVLERLRKAAALRNASKFSESEKTYAEAAGYLEQFSLPYFADPTFLYIALSDAYLTNSKFEKSFNVMLKCLERLLKLEVAKQDNYGQLSACATQIEQIIKTNPEPAFLAGLEAKLKNLLRDQASRGAARIYLECVISGLHRKENAASTLKQDQELLNYYSRSKLSSQSVLCKLHYCIGEDLLALGKRAEARAHFQLAAANIQSQDSAMILSSLRLAEFCAEDAEFQKAGAYLDRMRRFAFEYALLDHISEQDCILRLFEQRFKIVEQLKGDTTQALQELNYVKNKQGRIAYFF